MGLLTRMRQPLMKLAACRAGAAGVPSSPTTRAEQNQRNDEAHAALEATHGLPDGAGPVRVSNAQRASTLVRAIQASIAGDSCVISELYTKDVKGWSQAIFVSSAAELAVEFEDREEAFSDIKLDLSPLDVAGDRACVEWVATARHTGPLVIDDDAVVEATGLRCRLRGVTVAEFDGDRIRSFRQYWDDLALIEQLGLLADA
jgi:ketosteroid isomerase-like protein